MTTGYATVADGQPSAASYAEQDAARWDKEQQKQHWIELGAAVLGYTQSPIRENGQTIGYAWQQRQQEQTGLPAGLVAQAKHALAVEASAREALLARYAEARSYIGQHQLSDQAARTYSELHSAEAATAHRASAAATPRALYALGKVAEEIATHRATLNGISARTRQADELHQAALAQIETDKLTALAALARLGIS
jgi:hypothetical protein